MPAQRVRPASARSSDYWEVHQRLGRTDALLLQLRLSGDLTFSSIDAEQREHDAVAVEIEVSEYGHVNWQARCSCGWTSRVWVHEDDAWTLADDHVDAPESGRR
jgi:hypothetical protein